MTSSDDSKLGPLFAQPLELSTGLTIADLNRYLPALRKLEDMKVAGDPEEGLFLADGLSGLAALPSESIDLVLADPPQHPWAGPEAPGKALTLSDYYSWNQSWLKASQRILKPTGSIYLFSGWRYSGMYQALLSEVFQIQMRITWRQANGRSAVPPRAWQNNLGDIWFATKSAKYYFRDDLRDVTGSGPGDPRSNLWSDIMTVVPDSTWIKGEKPSAVYQRVIRASSSKLNWVVDPFMRCGGSGIAAKNCGRRFIGFEVDRDHLLLAMKRIDRS
ncbi:MAG: site-specific DNA-methyltransferase [Candidatus Neomarinimicrobiota bacterium]